MIDAYGELVEEGCLAIFGPHIGDNSVAIREVICERFRVPALSVTGSDEALSEWFFAFPMGSHFDEPIFWSDQLAKGGHTEVGVLIEQSLVGEAYLKNFRRHVTARASASSQRRLSRRRRKTSARPCGPCMTRKPPQSSTAASASAL